MSIGRLILLILAALWLWSATANAQSDALVEAIIQYRVLYSEGRYQEAVRFAERALELAEGELDPEAVETAMILNDVAEIYRVQGRYKEALPLQRRALGIRENRLGPHHPEVAQSLNNLALLYDGQGRYAEAEPLYERALEIWMKARGPLDPAVATGLNNLALLYVNQGRYGEAEQAYTRALAIDEDAFGPDHPNLTSDLNNLADLYRVQGRYDDAAPLYERALAIGEKALGPDHPDVAATVNNLALLYHQQGLYREAEPLYRRALTVLEKVLGPDHPSVARNLNNLAKLYESQGRYSEAELLLKRARTIIEQALGPEHPDVAVTLSNLAGLYFVQRRYAKAEPLYRRALTIREKALGPDHPAVATGLNNLAAVFDALGRLDEVEALHSRALAIRERALGPNHPEVAQSLANLAEVLADQGRFDEAEALHKRTLAIRQQALGPDHPGVALGLNNLALLYYAQNRDEEALAHIRRATDIHRGRAARAADAWSGGGLSEQKTVRSIFLGHVVIATSLIEREPDRRAALTAEAFEVGQLARATSAAAAVSRMAARFAAGDDDLARLVRARQDAVEEWQRLDRVLVKAVSQPPDKRDVQAEARLREDLAALDRRLTGLDAELAQAFPDYAELATPEPVALADIQKLLGPLEALMVYLVWDESTFLWVVRPDRAELHRIAVGADDLAGAVAELRAGLDPTTIRLLGEIPPFDTTKAYELYSRIFAPAEPLLDGVRHLMVVPDGALQSLPVGVLVTEEPQGPITDFADYRRVPWLARRYAVTVLPSVGSLRALRQFAKATQATQPFIGFGDPVLDGEPGFVKGIGLAALFTRGAIADVELVRQWPALPETADELAAIARALGAGDDSLFLRERATERGLKSADLSDYRVLAFATHGLVAGQLSGVAEPALVLTPPEEGTEEDDGLLTASEVALLKLDADWVILSACNTAAPDGSPGAEGLSGLARAFFYAGSRALLVSHWPVFSDPAVKLTTRMFAEASDHPEIGRAEALRRSMVVLMEDPENPNYAHPMFWAPFIVVGEGGVFKSL